MSESFTRNVEDFDCTQCGHHVVGNGFTDHCPRCLFSLHVDVNPGDRASDCGGKMEPVNIAPARGGYTIYYRCMQCGYEHTNKAADDDDITSWLEKRI